MADTSPVAPSVGIDHTLSLITATKPLLVDGIGIVKSGSVGVSSVLKGVKVVSDLYAVGKELTQVMPELKDIDALESARIGGAVYSACREIITSVQGLQALKK